MRGEEVEGGGRFGGEVGCDFGGGWVWEREGVWVGGFVFGLGLGGHMGVSGRCGFSVPFSVAVSVSAFPRCVSFGVGDLLVVDCGVLGGLGGG